MARLFAAVLLLLTLILSGCSDVRSSGDKAIEPSSAEDVAVLTVYAYDGKSETKNLIACYGHAFLGIENISENTLYIYNYPIEPGESLTVSWWAVDRHMGIWFNMESSYIELHGRYAERWSVSRTVDEAQLQVLTDFMRDNDHYTPLSNCSKNVTDCWNTIAQDGERLTVYAISTPERLKEDICTFPQAEYARETIGGDICYYDSTAEVFITYEMEADTVD